MNQKLCFLVFLFLPLTLLSQEKFPTLNGWEIISEVDSYNSENLWEYINGAAEQFYDYGFEELKSAEFKSETISAVIDIYDMGTALNAFGIYMTERPRKGNYLNIGTEAIVTPPAQALLLKDKYYVKINFFDGDLTDKNGSALLKEIDSGLPGESKKPKEIDLLPEENKVEASTFYSKNGYQGLSELKNCLAARYEDGEETSYEFFVIILESKEHEDKFINSLNNKWKPINQNGHEILYRKIPYKGYMGILNGRNGIIGVTDSPDIETMKRRLLTTIK